MPLGNLQFLGHMKINDIGKIQTTFDWLHAKLENIHWLISLSNQKSQSLIADDQKANLTII